MTGRRAAVLKTREYPSIIGGVPFSRFSGPKFHRPSPSVQLLPPARRSVARARRFAASRALVHGRARASQNITSISAYLRAAVTASLAVFIPFVSATFEIAPPRRRATILPSVVDEDVLDGRQWPPRDPTAVPSLGRTPV